MKALQLTAWGEEARFQDVEVPEPGPGEVLIEVLAAGACHSDLHLMEWNEGLLPWELPFTLGHENAGRVHSRGAGVTGIEDGEPVAVYGPWGCGRCQNCRLGMESYCERQAEIPYAGGGLGTHGGMARYMLVPSPRHLVSLGDLDPVQAAPLTDAGLTPYHAIQRSRHLLTPGSSAVVIGVGGLGHMGVQILAATSPAQVIAVDVAKEKVDLALQVGASVGVLAGDSAAEEVREATRGRGADLVIDVVGSDDTLALAAQVARPLGHLTIVGIAGGTLPVGFFTVPYELSIATTYWGSVTELMEVVSLAQEGKIKAHVERFALDEALDAYARMRRGDLEGRAVIIP